MGVIKQVFKAPQNVAQTDSHTKTDGHSNCERSAVKITLCLGQKPNQAKPGISVKGTVMKKK